MATTEEWRPIDGHPNHQVSSLGRVRSHDHIVNDKGSSYHRKGRIFKLSAGGNGYVRVAIERKWYTVHRLVAQAFIAHSESHNVVNHKNGIKTDNRVENLEWTDVSGNGIHAHKNGLNTMTDAGRKSLSAFHRGRKLSEETKRKIALKHKSGYKHSEETKRKISESITKWHQNNEKNKINI